MYFNQAKNIFKENYWETNIPSCFPESERLAGIVACDRIFVYTSFIYPRTNYSANQELKFNPYVKEKKLIKHGFSVSKRRE